MKSPRSWLLRYGGALVLTAATTLLIFGFKHFFVRGIVVLYIPAVMCSAWYGGLGPGLVATLLSIAATDFFFMDPTYSFVIRSGDDIAELAVFSLVAVLTSVLNTAQQKAREALLDNQEKIRLVFDVTRAANEAEVAGHAFRFALQRLCEDGRWSYAHVYQPLRQDPQLLVPSGDYHSGDELRFRALRAATVERPLRRGEGLAGWAMDTGHVEWGMGPHPGPIAEILRQAGVQSAVAFPVRVGHETVGVFECFSVKSLERNETLVHLMEMIGLELGRVVERQRLQEDYSEAVWEQQRVIAQELHDGLGQELTGLGFLSQSLTNSLASAGETRNAQRLTDGLKRCLEQIRGLARGVSPVAQDAEGLMISLRQLSESTTSSVELDCRFDCPRSVPVEENQVAVHLYRIAQEAVTNAVRHARASRISIALERNDEGLRLSVTDDGVGIPSTVTKEGSGMRIMRYRASAIGAALRVERGPARGTIVTCVVAERGRRDQPRPEAPSTPLNSEPAGGRTG
jgi:signal transduction histidine kinase